MALRRRREASGEPAAQEPFGTLRGRPLAVETFDGTRLAVEELGAGPCVVFVHGFALSQDIWHYQRRDLPSCMRCVFYDQRGHGRSGSAVGDDYSLDALGRDLVSVIDATGEEQVVVVGHSLGGMAALEVLAERAALVRNRIAGLVLVDSAPGDVAAGFAASALSAVPATLRSGLVRAALKIIGRDPALARRLRRPGTRAGMLATRWLGFGLAASRAQVAFMDGVLAASDPSVWTKVLPSVLAFDRADALAGLRLPVLVAVGDHDRLTPIAAARRFADEIPDACLLVLRGAGHSAFLERYAVFNQELAVFVAEVLRQPGGRASYGC